MEKTPPLKPAFDRAKKRPDINPERPKTQVLKTIKNDKPAPAHKPKWAATKSSKSQLDQSFKTSKKSETGISENKYGIFNSERKLNAGSLIRDETRDTNTLKDTFNPNANNKDRDFTR